MEGIITEITLKAHKIPAYSTAVRVSFDSIHAAALAVQDTLAVSRHVCYKQKCRGERRAPTLFRNLRFRLWLQLPASFRLNKDPSIGHTLVFRRSIAPVRQKHHLAWEHVQIGDIAVDPRYTWSQLAPEISSNDSGTLSSRAVSASRVLALPDDASPRECAGGYTGRTCGDAGRYNDAGAEQGQRHKAHRSYHDPLRTRGASSPCSKYTQNQITSIPPPPKSPESEYCKIRACTDLYDG